MPSAESDIQVSEPADLYSLPLDRFTEARNQLAGRLRQEGDDEEAARVSKLRKPSIAAWALNQVARNSPALVDRLVESQRRIREADTVANMQKASEERRQVINALLGAVGEELRAAGRADTAQTRERVNSTLMAVGTDAEGEADLRAGTLVQDLEPSGAGWGDFALVPPPPPDPAEQAQLEAEHARLRLARLEEEAAEAERRLEIAERAVKEARRQAKQARAAVEAAAKEV